MTAPHSNIPFRRRFASPVTAAKPGRLWRWLAVALPLWAGLPEAPAAPPKPEVDLSYEHSMDLLQADMKLRQLQSLNASGHYVPPALVAHYQEEYQQLADDLHVAATRDQIKIDAWRQETQKISKQEDLEMQKLALKWGKKTLSATKDALQNLRNWELSVNQWDRDKSKNAFHMAQAVTLLIHQQNRDKLGDDYTKAVGDLYRGALGEGLKLSDRIQNLQRQRMAIETSLQYCKLVESSLKELEKSPADRVQAEAEKALLGYLKDNYTGIDAETEANIKWSLAKVKNLSQQAWATWNKVDQLQNDPSLAANPVALRTAKQFALLGTLYNVTLGFAKDYKVLEAFGPLGDFLDFYGQAISLVPTVAQKMQITVAKIDQDDLSVRLESSWGKMPGEPKPYWETSLRRAYNGRVDIATGRELREDVPNAKFYLLVAPAAVPPGYVILDPADYQRLALALACERALFAWDEAVGKLPPEERLKYLIEGPLALKHPDASPALKTDLARLARAMPFDARQLRELAQGRVITYRGGEWTAEKFQTECDRMLDAQAEKLLIATAVGEYRPEYKALWGNFRELLASVNLALTPDQILRLFGTYQVNGPAQVREFLTRLVEKREAARLGLPALGIHDVSLVDAQLIYGLPATIQARAMVSNLAPGREVEAELVWNFSPAWAAAQDGQMKVTLRNGLNTFRRDLRVLKEVPAGPLKVRATLTIPPGPGQPAPLVKSREELIGVGRISPPVLQFEPARVPAAGGEVKIRATFRLEGLLPDEKIKLRYHIDADDFGPIALIEEKEFGNGEGTIERTITVPSAAAAGSHAVTAVISAPWGEDVRGTGTFQSEPAATVAPAAPVTGNLRLFTARWRPNNNTAEPATQILATESVVFLADLKLDPPAGAQSGQEVKYEFEVTSGGKRVLHSSSNPGLPQTGGAGGYTFATTLPSYPDEQYPFNFPKTPKSGTFDWGNFSMSDPRFLPLLRAGARSFEARLTVYSEDNSARKTVLSESTCTFQVDYQQFTLKTVRPVRGYEALVGRQGPGVSVMKCELSGTTGHVRLVERDKNSAEIAALEATLELPAWADQGDNQSGDRVAQAKIRLSGKPSPYDARGNTAHSGLLRGLATSNAQDLNAASPEWSGKMSVHSYTEIKEHKISNPSFTVNLQLAGRPFAFDVVYETGGGQGGAGSAPPASAPGSATPAPARPGAPAAPPPPKPGQPTTTPTPSSTPSPNRPVVPGTPAIKPAQSTPAAKPPAAPGPPTLTAAAAQAMLGAPEPWKNPRVQALMDEWLSLARPTTRDGREYRYTEWGVINGNGITALVPDHTGQTRHEWLWKNCLRLTSARHGTMREYLERRLQGLPGETAAAPPAARSPAPAVAPAPRPVNLSGLWDMNSGNVQEMEWRHQGNHVGGTLQQANGTTTEFDANYDPATRLLQGEIRSASPKFPFVMISALELKVNADATEAAGQVWLVRDGGGKTYLRGQEFSAGINNFPLMVKRANPAELQNQRR